jgi:1-phosphofructokinase
VITAVTPNPSLDRTLHIGRLRRGALNRATSYAVEPSGKGVNVAIALHAVGVPSTAVLPVGGDSGRSLLDMIAERGVAFRAVSMRGAVRTNVSVIEDDGVTTKLNEPGPSLSAGEVADLIETALAVGAPGEWIAWCGSLPAGFAPADLEQAIATGRAAGRRIAVDTSETALRAVLDGATLPDLVKPNVHELADLVDRPLPTLGDVVNAAADLVQRGIGAVAVTLGGQGAVVVDSSGALFGHARVDRVVNTAGAGDAFLAGYLAASDEPVNTRLVNALRFGAAAVQSAGTLVQSAPPEIPVEVGAPDRGTRLHA